MMIAGYFVLENGCKHAIGEWMDLGLMLVMVLAMVRRRSNTGLAMLHSVKRTLALSR